MVDFQNDSTVSTPPSDLLKILIIQRRNDVIDAIETYYKLQLRNADVPDNIIRARILSLVLELGNAYKRWTDKEHTTTTQTILTGSLMEVLNIFHEVNIQLDNKKITRIDTRQDFDRKNIEKENEIMLS